MGLPGRHELLRRSLDSSSADVYGTNANFQANYQLTSSFLDAHKAPFLNSNRIWIGGFDVFQHRHHRLRLAADLRGHRAHDRDPAADGPPLGQRLGADRAQRPESGQRGVVAVPCVFGWAVDFRECGRGAGALGVARFVEREPDGVRLSVAVLRCFGEQLFGDPGRDRPVLHADQRRGWPHDPGAGDRYVRRRLELPATSGPTPVVAVAVPSVSGGPSISGSVVEGQKLSESHASWSGSPTGYGYQWQSCDASGSNCSAIQGATGQSYTLTIAEVGRTIRVQETATNAGGWSRSPATSGPTAVVAVAVPSVSGGPSISGSVVEGQELSESHASWSGSPTGYGYQWQSCDASGSSCWRSRARPASPTR